MKYMDKYSNCICFALILLFLFNACRKDSDQNNNGNEPSCYILRLVDDPEEFLELKFTYNNPDQLTRMDSREDDYHDYISMQYDNSRNVVRIDYYDDDGDLFGHQTFEYNNGKVTKGYEHTNNDAVYDYNYNANGLLESISLSSVRSLSSINNANTYNNDGLLSSRLLNAGVFMNNNTPRLGAIINFQWNSSGSITKESWLSGETLLESYDYTYDNKINSFKQFNFPVLIITGAYARTFSSNNFTKEVWYSVLNGESETTTVTYQYNGNCYPASIVFDGSDKYRMEYRCE